MIAPRAAPYSSLLREAGCDLTEVSGGPRLDHRAALLIRERFRENPFDILYLEGLATPASMVLVAQTLPVKTVVRLCYLETGQRMPILNRVLYRSRKVAWILSDVDPAQAGDALTARWLQPKTTILPLGHDPGWYPASYDLTAFGIPQGAFSVAAVSDGSEHAGLGWILECARGLPMDLPIHFLLVAPKASHDRLRRLIRKTPFTQRFHLSDSMEEAPGLLAGCSVLVVTDWHAEIQRRTCRQCLASGVPVLAQAVRPMEQIIRPAVNGELVPEGDTDILAHTLFELYEDSERRTRLATAARRLAQSMPSMEQVVQETVATFARVLEIEDER